MFYTFVIFYVYIYIFRYTSNLIYSIFTPVESHCSDNKHNIFVKCLITQNYCNIYYYCNIATYYDIITYFRIRQSKSSKCKEYS